MRDGEARLFDRLVAVDEEVEVDRARPEARAFAAIATEAGLDGEQALEQRSRAEFRLHLRGAVEEVRLVEVADGLGLAQAGDRHELDALLGRELLEGGLDLPLRLAEVRADADEGRGHDNDSDRASVPCASGAPPRPHRDLPARVLGSRERGLAAPSGPRGRAGRPDPAAAAPLPARADRARPAARPGCDLR